MIAQYVRRNGKYVCSNCRVEVREIEPECWFCGALITNFEEVAIENFKKL